MSAKKVVVLRYDPEWEEDFRKISEEIGAALGDLALRIEHVGSTSVKGLSAKPVIDIDAVIRDDTALSEVISALSRIGYTHEGDLGIPGREAFRYEGKDHLRKHHLYVCKEGASELRRHTAFRDYLRSHPEAAAEYGRIKEEGAELYPDDMDGYIAHKTPFIELIYSEIGLSQQKEAHQMSEITLAPLEEEDREQFILDNQAAFNYGALEEFGLRDDHFEEDGEIISRATIERSIDTGEAYRILRDDQKVGGVVIQTEGDRGDLDLLFVSPEAHSRGIGYAAWCEVEKLHPEVRVWETVTPYFEKRNIHFYVNRCGFHIVEFYNSHHPDPDDPEASHELDEQFPDGMFRFEKIIKTEK